MDTQKKVSIIIPVYGVEAYLEECINSLLNQTYTNLEIIVIDDASPDRCPEICDSYTQVDQRVRVIHKLNGGAASARNIGLNILTGEYFTFVDSDDYVKPTYIEELVVNLEDHDADISVCSFEYLYKDKTVVKGYQGNLVTMTQIDFLKRFLTDWTCGIIWNKLFKVELLKQIRFPEGHKIDDEFFTYRLFMKAEKVVMFSSILYEYRMRSSSVMNATNRERLLEDKALYLLERFDNITSEYPQLSYNYTQDLLDSIIWLKREALYYNISIKAANSVFKKKIFTILLSNVSLKKKVLFFYLYFWDKTRVNPIEPDTSEKLFE